MFGAPGRDLYELLTSSKEFSTEVRLLELAHSLPK